MAYCREPERFISSDDEDMPRPAGKRRRLLSASSSSSSSSSNEEDNQNRGAGRKIINKKTPQPKPQKAVISNYPTPPSLPTVTSSASGTNVTGSHGGVNPNKKLFEHIVQSK